MYGYPVHYVHWPVPVQERRRVVDTRDQAMAAEILRAVQREERAGNFYERLAQQAPSENVRTLIMIIRDERIKHLQNFSQLYRQMTGREPQLLQEPVPAPETFTRGVELAIRDELESVDAYRDIADGSADPRIKRAFQRAAEDEYRHSTWFANILVGLGT